MSDSLQKGNNNSIQRNGPNRFQFTPNYASEEEGTNNNPLDPKKIISILWRYKWIVMLFLIAGATGAWFYADSLSPTYRSSGTLLISTSNTTTNDELSQIISQTTGYNSSTFENELQVLQSRKFSRQVAEKLIQEDPGEISTYPVLWTHEEETGDIYKSGLETVASRIRSGLDLSQPSEESNVVAISFESASPREAAMVVNEAMEVYVENSTRQNRQAADSTAQFLAKREKELKEKLDASEQRLRRFMDSSGIVQVDEQASGIVSQRSNIDSQLQSVNLELERIEEAIANYEKRLEKIKPGLAKQFSEALGARIQSSQQELARYEREKTMIISKNPGVLERDPVPPRLKYIDKQIARLKEEIQNLSAKLFTDDEFIGLNSEDRAQMVTNIQGNLIDLRIAQNQNRAQREALLQQKKEMTREFSSLPEGMIELARLQRNVTLNEELWLNVSRQYADISVLKQSQFGFGRIIDPAEVPGFPVSPNKKIILLLGFMLGGLFSAGFIFVREFMDDSVKNVDQLRTRYLPAFNLSVIPTFEKVAKKNRKSFTTGSGQIPEEIVMFHDSASVAAESIRRLKNNIIYQYGDKPPKTIAVTSPEKGDGKSTVVANLGIAFAEEGFKTLIIGTDFRRPKIQKYFGLTDSKGLSDYLDDELTFQQLLTLIQSTDLTNLKVITAGKVTQRPEVIATSKVFQDFIKKMEGAFDVILLDTPPFGIISDSTPLLKKAETTLVVVRYRKTNKEMLMRTIEELERINANVTDIVLNDFNHRKEAGSYYGAGYYQTLYDNYEVYVS